MTSHHENKNIRYNRHETNRIFICDNSFDINTFKLNEIVSSSNTL